MAGVCALQANPHIFSRTVAIPRTLLSRAVFSARSSEHEAGFENAARLSSVHTGGTKNRTWRRIGSMNNRQVSAKEKRVLAICWRHGETESIAARAIQ